MHARIDPRSLLRELRNDTQGAVAVLVALSFPVLVGVAALAVDIALFLNAKNAAQGAADNAALSAVVAASAGASGSNVTNEAQGVAAVNGFTTGNNGITVTVNNPPTSGSYTTNAQAYEVIVSQPQTLFFGKALGVAPTVTGRAVVLQGQTPPCIIALDSGAKSAINMSGGTTAITASNCDVAVNSSNAQALTLSGGSTLTASDLTVVGSYATSGSSTVIASKITTNTTAYADPYTSLTVPSFSGCDKTNYILSGGAETISPGVYCGGITVSGGGKLTLQSGIYIINGGSLNVSSSTLSGSEVSIVVTHTAAATTNWGTITISGGSTVTLSAPKTGSMQGVALFMDRNAPTNLTNNISGGSTQAVTGAIYIPTQLVNYSGGSANASSCLQLVARLITFSGSSGFGRSCGDLRVAGFQTGSGKPVE